MVCLHFADQGVIALVHDQVQRGVAKDGKPHEGEYRGHEHHADDKLPYGATPADLGNEQADERCPGDGPAEDEQGPVANPVTARIGLQVESALDDVVQVAARVLQKALQNVHRGAHAEDEQHQRYRQRHIEDG